MLLAKLILQAGLLAAAMCAAGVGLAVAAGLNAPSSGQIAFISGRDGDYEIYLMDVEANLTAQLTNNEVDDIYPAWSPDGCCLAYSSRRGGHSAIYTMNLLTGATQQLTNLENVAVTKPHWSPEGDRLVMEITPGEQARTETCFLTLASADFDCVADGFGASWSPDGTSVASYVQETTGQFAVRLISLEDYFDTRLVQNVGGHVGVRPAWSPDGSQIAYSCNDDICVMNADGSAARTLIDGSGSELNADWSPDGKVLVFDSRSRGNVELFLYDVEFMTIRRLTYSDGADGTPVWRP